MRKNLSYVFQIEDINMYDRYFEPDFEFSGESHSVWEVVFVESGSVVATENENIYAMSSGDIVIHAPMEFHRIRSAENTSPRVIVLSFNLTGILPEEICDGVFSLTAKESEEYIRISTIISDYVKKDIYSEFTLQEIGYSLGLFLLNLSKKHSSKNSFSNTQSANHYKTIAESMQKEVLSNLTLDDFSRIHHLSVSYIQSVFKKYTGISAKHYYLNLRTIEASNLILSGASIREIADKMNFSSPNYFTTFFKKQTGLTPLEYKLKRTVD